MGVSAACGGDDVRVFYEDLSEYTYQDVDTFGDRESFRELWYRPEYIRLNVGWLQAGKPYPTARARGLRGEAGGHPAGPVDERLPRRPRVRPVSRGGRPGRNGEIRIPGEAGVAYAAPFLITHYITVHGYRPPQVFVDAVLAVELGAWAAARWPDVPFPWVPENAEHLLE